MYGLKHCILPNSLDKLTNFDSKVRKSSKKKNTTLKFDSKNNLRCTTEKFVKKKQKIKYIFYQKS